MAILAKVKIFAAASAVLALTAGGAYAAQCGDNAGGFAAWKAEFAQQAAANGIKGNALNALAETTYATKTIHADRNQKSFKLSLDQFMVKRGGKTIASKGKAYKKQHAALFKSIEQRYGVPAGPLIAIWGMETGFGGFLGNQHTLSAVATLAYDCRRSEYFTEQLYAALQLVAERHAPSRSNRRGPWRDRPDPVPARQRAEVRRRRRWQRQDRHGPLEGRRAGLDRQLPARPRLAARAAATSPARSISQHCRAGTRPASTSRRSPSSAPRSTATEAFPPACQDDFRALWQRSFLERIVRKARWRRRAFFDAEEEWMLDSLSGLPADLSGFGNAEGYSHYPKTVTPGPAAMAGGGLLKWYDIAAHGTPVAPGTDALARRFLTAETAAGRLDLKGQFGFVILHRCGGDFHFLLVSSWRNANEMWETVYAKTVDATDFSLFPAARAASRDLLRLGTGGGQPRARGVRALSVFRARRGGQAGLSWGPLSRRGVETKGGAEAPPSDRNGLAPGLAVARGERAQAQRVELDEAGGVLLVVGALVVLEGDQLVGIERLLRSRGR